MVKPSNGNGYVFRQAMENFTVSFHETSSAHLKATISFQTRSQESGWIDFELIQQLDDEINYWWNVLKRVASVILFVSERGLPFRGDNEIIGYAHNGNYLGLLELLAEYDDFLKGHIGNHANRGRGRVNYLSSTICNEFRQLIVRRVFDEIIRRIKHSQYYSFTLDSTKDEGYIDQLVLIFRYIEENGDQVERFLPSMPNQGHKAKDMFDGLMNFLNKKHLNIKNCRGQSYDNSSAVSEKFAGLQALVREANDLACWVPCFGHSLNLVGTDTMNSCPKAKFFFSFLEQIYVFFTSSTERYSALVSCLRSACTPENPVHVPKRVSTTRWSSRADATKFLVRGYAQIKSTLLEMVGENSKARGLYDQMSKLDIGIFAVFWNEILFRVNHTSKCLQSPEIVLNTSIEMLKSLKSFIEIKRDSLSGYERRGAELCGNKQYVMENKRKCTEFPHTQKYIPDSVF
ncbi:zinc finger MYM-type protein 1-like [Diprion similis]|uniref:zinc finger MYM-type protein 1-like n=1 Tax=Diprion similis TaxID=362088 RepID=UPI001EF783C8|nr:zinc finger MYM-type protein 1-like [Diprion similis]